MRVEADATETLTYNVTGLRPYSRYAVRVRAENMIGTSDPSEPSGEIKPQRTFLKSRTLCVAQGWRLMFGVPIEVCILHFRRVLDVVCEAGSVPGAGGRRRREGGRPRHHVEGARAFSGARDHAF